MTEFRLNAYHIMWLFVFFDLPTNTKKQRKNAASFRKMLEKDGFTVHVSSPFDESRKLFNATISWGNAYKNVIPYLVYSYTNGLINTFPESQISTFAQKLYVTAKRANTF